MDNPNRLVRSNRKPRKIYAPRVNKSFSGFSNTDALKTFLYSAVQPTETGYSLSLEEEEIGGKYSWYGGSASAEGVVETAYNFLTRQEDNVTF